MMTEEQAYAALGWALEGGHPNPFILPATGNPDEHQAFRCTKCGGGMICVKGYPFCEDEPWCCCGGKMIELLESGRDGNGPAC